MISVTMYVKKKERMYVVTGSRDYTARIWSVPLSVMQLDPNGTAAPTAAPPA